MEPCSQEPDYSSAFAQYYVVQCVLRLLLLRLGPPAAGRRAFPGFAARGGTAAEKVVGVLTSARSFFTFLGQGRATACPRAARTKHNMGPPRCWWSVSWREPLAHVGRAPRQRYGMRRMLQPCRESAVQPVVHGRAVLGCRLCSRSTAQVTQSGRPGSGRNECR
jgi:hypothetical protein